MKNTTFIYTLEHPTTGEIRYVGKSNNPKTRLNSHIWDSKQQEKTYKNDWVKSLLNQNLKPLITILDEIPTSEWRFWEMHYIALFKSWGLRLVNGTDGGDGFPDGQVPWNKGLKNCYSEEHIKKLSEKKIGNSNAKNWIRTDEYKSKISNTMKQKSGIETSFYGKHHTEETKKKISVTLKNKTIG